MKRDIIVMLVASIGATIGWIIGDSIFGNTPESTHTNYATTTVSIVKEKEECEAQGGVFDYVDGDIYATDVPDRITCVKPKEVISEINL